MIKNFNASSTDTQAVLYYAGFPANELVLAFRGSSTPVDLDYDLDYVLVNPTLSNVACSGCQVHRGFQEAYLSLSSQVRSAVTAAQSQYPLSSLTITGHSLGAGLAALAAAEFAANGYLLNVYTYGEPRNGNSAWSKYVDSKLPLYNRVTHYNDGVPQIPPVLLGFAHHGTEYWISQEYNNNASTTFNCGGGEHTVRFSFTNSPRNMLVANFHRSATPEQTMARVPSMAPISLTSHLCQHHSSTLHAAMSFPHSEKLS